MKLHDLLPHVPALAAFMAAVLALSMYLLAVAGHFPAARRSPRLSGGGGAPVLWGTILLALLALALALAGAWRALPPSIAVIGGGAMILAAPPALQSCPDSFVDGRRGLLVLAGSAAAASLLLWSIGGPA